MALPKSTMENISNLSLRELEDISKHIVSVASEKRRNNFLKAKRFISKTLRVGDIIDKNVSYLHAAKIVKRKGNKITIKWKEPLHISKKEHDKRKKIKKAVQQEYIETFSLNKLVILNIWRKGKKYFDITDFQS